MSFGAELIRARVMNLKASRLSEEDGLDYRIALPEAGIPQGLWSVLQGGLLLPAPLNSFSRTSVIPSILGSSPLRRAQD